MSSPEPDQPLPNRTQGVEPGGLPLLDTSLRIAPGPHRTTFG